MKNYFMLIKEFALFIVWYLLYSNISLSNDVLLIFNLILLQTMLTRISLNFMFLSFSESWMVYQNEYCWIITYGQKYTSEKKAHYEIQLSLQVMLWRWIDYCCIYPLDNYYLCKHAFNYNSETRVINYVWWCFYRTYYTYIISPIVSSWQIYTF